MDYAARQHRKIQKRSFLERLVKLTNRRKLNRFQMYTATFYFASRKFATWAANAATLKRHREFLKSHLLNFTVGKRVIPAWKRYTKKVRRARRQTITKTSN